MLEKRELEMRGSEILKELEGNSEIFSDVNKTFIVGIIEKKLRYNHKYKQEKFFKTRIEVIRNSGISDFIPVIISEKVLTKSLRKKIRVGNMVAVAGRFYSFNTKDKDGKTHLKLCLSAKYIKMLKDESIIEKNSYYKYSLLKWIYLQRTRFKKNTNIKSIYNRFTCCSKSTIE